MDLFLDFSFITGIIISFLILFILFKEKKKEPSKKILISIFILFFFVFLFFYSYIHAIKLLFIATFIFQDAVVVLIGPLLFLYVKCIFSNSKTLLKKNRIHFLFPLIYIVIISIPSLILILTKHPLFKYIASLETFISLAITYSLIYCLIALQLLLTLQKSIKHHYSNIDDKDLKWVKLLLIGSIIIISIDLMTTLYELFFGVIQWNIGYLTVVPMVFFISYLGYYGISQSKILLPEFLVNTITTNNKPEQKELKKIFDHQEMTSLKLELINIIENKKPYLIEDLTLNQLATLIPTTDKKLSTLLNQFMKISFYDYINSHRVAEVKKMIHDPISNKYTLLAIAYECGFKSKTSFNRIFKKTTGYSPSAYKKQVI